MNKFLDVIDDYILKYAYYREPVAGSKYLDINLNDLNSFDPVVYEIDKNNEYDDKAIKLYQNNIHIGYVHKNYIQEMILSYSKRKNFKIEIYLSKIDFNKEEIRFQIGFYRKYSSTSFATLSRFALEVEGVKKGVYYNIRKNKRANSYYIKELDYVFNTEDSLKIKEYLDNYAYALQIGKDDNKLEVIFVI